jgi:hypothetical protein
MDLDVLGWCAQGSALAQKLVRNKSPEDKQLKSNPFVAVVLEKPQPQLGMLVGHTNTEYSTQNPIFGQNTNSKVGYTELPSSVSNELVFPTLGIVPSGEWLA